MPLFSQHMQDIARSGFQARLVHAGPRGQDIAARISELPPDTADAVRWLYGTSPLSDWLNYDFSLFRDCGAHGVLLRQDPALPEDLFLHYVLALRVNEEELSNCRALFHSLLAPRLQGLPPVDAVLEVNRWCAEQVTYRSTDDRTRSALGIYRSGFGRCGEESTFAVNALRAAGIPARQIYTPRWAHCDDNHAWVEVWVEGAWHFLGACEPEAVLDRGWFTSAASRAMVIHSRRFGPAEDGEEVIGQSGAVTVLNQISRYANTKCLTVHVMDPAGRAVEGAEVCFGILNMAEVYPAAAVLTGPDGTARLTCGYGSFCVRVRKGGTSCGQLVQPEADDITIILDQDAPPLDTWEDFTVIAPRDRPSPLPQPTPEQKALGRAWTAEAAQVRSQRELPAPAYTPEEQAVLAALTDKDRLDADPAVLEEALACAGGHEDCGELFWPWVVCPRVADEPLRTGRRFILDCFSLEQKDTFRKFPSEIWRFIREHVRFDPALEYGQLVTLPTGVLSACSGSPLSCEILFVSICRTLGVPARLSLTDGKPEYWDGCRFQAVDAPEESASVTLEHPDGWKYMEDFSVAALEDGTYRTLRLSGPSFQARPGDYRILTVNRLPNGDQFASRYCFRLEAGESKAVRLRKRQADLSRMLGSYDLEEFTVYTEDGQAVPGSTLTQHKAVLIWLEEGAEPTEHILNELLERQEAFRQLRTVFLVRTPAALANSKLRQVLDALPEAQVYFDSFVPNVEAVARRVYVDHEKLPLAVVTTKPLHAVYASSGYNVGCGEMLLRICSVTDTQKR